MIIKYDHLTFVAQRGKEEYYLPKEVKPSFIEKGLKNLTCKKKFMGSGQDEHDLYYFNDKYPLEYIFYDAVLDHSSIWFEEDIVHGEYYDKSSAIAFLISIFGNKVYEENDCVICNMRGVLDHRDFFLKLHRSEKSKEYYVDSEGYGVIALLQNKTFSDASGNSICTNTEEIIVNGKLLSICFVKSSSTNLIFEMIMVKDKKRNVGGEKV